MNALAAPAQVYPSMKVVQALARAAKCVAEVTCLGRSGDPRDPYQYARADDLVASAKDALHSEGLLVLPASSDEKSEPVGDTKESVIWLRQTFNVVHVESGEWLPFQADPWPLQKGKPIDKAMATAKTASKAYFYLSLLEIRRTGPNAEDMDADLLPAVETEKAPEKTSADSTAAGVSPRAKQSPAGARMSRQSEEKNREKVDPEKVAAELSKAAEEVFGEGSSGLSVHVDLDPTMPPTKDVASNPSTSVGALPAGVPSNPDEKSSGVLPESGGCKTADDSSTPPGVSLDSTGGDNSTPESWAPDDATPERGRPVGQRVESPKAPESPEVLRRRTAEGRAAKWETAKRRQARKAFWCVLCQPTAAEANDAEDAKDRGRIKPKDWHYDGTPGRGCEACVSKIRDEAKEGACSATK